MLEKIGSLLEALGSFFERSMDDLGELSGSWEKFRAAMEEGEVNEAGEIVSEVLDIIVGALGEAGEIVGKVLDIASPLDVEEVSSALEAVRGFLQRAFEVGSEIPAERLVAVAAQLFVAASRFAAQDYVGGTLAALSAIRSVATLYAEYGDTDAAEVAALPAPDEVLNGDLDRFDFEDYEALDEDFRSTLKEPDTILR